MNSGMHRALPMPAVVSFHEVGALLSVAPVPGIPTMVGLGAVGSSWVHIRHIPPVVSVLDAGLLSS